MLIYKITNKITGKSYVGQTIEDLKVRWSKHYYAKSNCPYLNRAIKKYGKDAFSVEEIGKYTNLEDLNNAEQYYIEWFNCMAPNGYNLSGGGLNGGKRHLDTKLKISISNTGKKRSKESKKRMSLAHLNKPNPNKGNCEGRILSEETRNKMSIAQKIRYLKK